MFNKDELQRRMKELEAEVKSTMASDLSVAEKSDRLDKIEAEDKEIAVTLKNHARALAFRGASELGDDSGLPVEQKQVGDPRADYNVTQYKSMAEFAKTRQRGNFSFDFGLKTQGVAGLAGEAASGTSAAAALAGGSYFLAGPGGPGIAPQFLPGITELQFYPNVVADLFPSFPVSSPVVTYVLENAWTNAAAKTAEGATKPTSTNSLTRATEQIGKIANTVRVTDELIQDEPYFWSLIQRRLAQGVSRAEEVELLAGTGYPGINGLLGRSAGFTKNATVGAHTYTIGGAFGAGVTSQTVSVTPGRALTVQSTSFSTGVGDKGAQIAEAILSAITDIRYNTLFEPDAVIMNPADWQAVRLSKDSAGQYLGGSFFGNQYGVSNGAVTSSAQAVDTGLSLWNKKVVTTPVIPLGLIIVGDFGDAGQVLRKGGLQVDVTNSNESDFLQNIWAARAEERVGLLIERPVLFEVIQIVGEGS